jgi:small ligand-binding sensory domain FIST
LFLGEQSIDSGAAGMLMRGVGMRSVVSQGCRPIGQPLVVTKAQQNVIEQLGGQPPLEQLRALWPSLSPREQGLVQQGLHVGQVINEYQPQFRRGDFLVRNVVGADPQHGVIAIGDFVRPGQTVQFHVRDAQTADEDLRELLAAARDERQAAAALLFTCNGRGTRLFSEPHHDAAALADLLGDIPVAGFFAQGEIGPVGGKNFLHGFTASVVLFDAAE